MRSILPVALLALSFFACSSESSSTAPTNDSGPAADTATTPSGITKFKTHIILGDSISDRGGTGPFFYDLLDKNDDAKWPDAAGKDFTTLFGSDLKIVKASRGGARGQNLGGQINTITGPLPGPVVVTITIGGNDVQVALGKILSGADDTPDREQFRGFLDAALADLTKPDRFGPGVKVAVYLTNVYDPSDGTGNFKFQSGTKCSGALGFYPAGEPTASKLDPWQKVFVDVVAKYPDAHLLNLQAKFNGHGVPSADTWFVPDCIHPNSAGHDAIRDLFLDAITTKE